MEIEEIKILLETCFPGEENFIKDYLRIIDEDSHILLKYTLEGDTSYTDYQLLDFDEKLTLESYVFRCCYTVC